MKTSVRLAAEFIGTLLILATVVGSGIAAERLCGGNMAVALLGNTLSIAAMLGVAIVMLAPISGAHFNPVVTLVCVLERTIKPSLAILYVAAQFFGAFTGLLLAQAMFGETLIQFSTHVRTGPAQWLSEVVATFGLIFMIRLTHKTSRSSTPVLVCLYVFAACWFTGSACFINPAMTLARAFTDSMTGIRLADVTCFCLAQAAGGVIAFAASHWFLRAMVGVGGADEAR